MARPKSNIEKSYVGLRMEVETVAMLENLSNEKQVPKSKIITDAVSLLISNEKCLICGSILPKGSQFCSICGNRLYTRDELEEVAERIKNRIIEEKKLKIGDIGNGFFAEYPITHHFDPVNNTSHYEFALVLTGPDGDVYLPAKDKSNKYIISMNDIIEEMHGNKYTVKLRDGKNIEVKITPAQSPRK